MKTVLLKGGFLITDEKMFKGDLLIEGEKISQIATEIDSDEIQKDWEVLDVTGKLIMPGVIDPHTHYQLKSRNTVTADDFISGSIAAACGGVTTIIDYSDHVAGVTLKDSATERINEAQGSSVIDFTLHQNITFFDEKVSQELEAIREIGISSVKIFTTYRREGYMIPKEQWAEVLKRLKELEILLTVHAEDDEMIMSLEEKYSKEGLLSPEYHPLIRPAQAEAKAIMEIGGLAKKVNAPLYIAHLSSKVGFEVLRTLKNQGVKIFAETTPHYLLLDESKLKVKGAQKFIMTPPLRAIEDCEMLWEGLKNEEIKVVATDHCAFNVEQKLQDNNCLTTLPGLPGTETMLPLIHHFGVNRGLFDYPQLVRLVSSSAARIFGLYPEKGSLLPGTDADIVVFDPEKRVVLSHEMLHSKAGYCPFEGIEVRGYPIMTFLRGELIYDNGEFCGRIGQGRFLKGNTSCLYEEF